MPHLDEGMFHAYLDNALPADAEQHLRECAECRANLEKARELKERADTILSRTAPVRVAMPSFDELQARAKSRSANAEKGEDKTRVRQQRSFSQLRTLAWAATVALAAAVGWYARSTALQTGGEQFASEGERGGRLTIPLPETDGTEAEESLQTANTDEAATVQEAPDVVAAVARETMETRPATVPDTAEAVLRIREAFEANVASPRQVPVAPTVTTVADPNEEPRQERQAMRSMPRLLAQVSADRAETETTQAGGGRGEGTEIVWTSLDEAGAESILDRPVPIVEGIPVVTYTTSSLNGHQAIRVLQRLESGRLLELVITPVDAADLPSNAKKGMGPLDSALGAAGDSVNMVDVARGNLRIRLSATLAADSLRVLAQNIPSGK